MYFKDVYLYIYSMSKNKEIAEDITADTFMKAMVKIKSFKGEGDIRVWLCQIAKNDYFNYLKRNKRLDEINKIEKHLASQKPQQSIHNIIENKELCGKLHKVLHTMNEPYKEVFTLRTFGELGFKEIGELFGKTENWACVTYHRSKDMIRRELAEE